MKRIIIHHTGGAYKPNDTDLKAYHYLIDNIGNIYEGVYKPEDNEVCKPYKYAAHTKLGNTGSIGIAACCNYGFDIKHKQSIYPLTLQQFKAMIKLSAKLCKAYNIPASQVFTHYWFDKCNNIKQGKSDITYIPWKPELAPDQVIGYFRSEIRKELNK
jgi:N-acetyl-anhydromuramyl-L-alanine amidase AmpD